MLLGSCVAKAECVLWLQITCIHPLPTGSATAVLDCCGKALDCTRGALVMGVLNVTPDSFSDGGRYVHLSDALRRAEAMLEEGASIIDIGGASSRPRGTVYGQGAAPVEEAEETARTAPVIAALARHFPEAVISIDSWRPAVATAALEAGAGMINDISGLRHSPAMAEVAASAGVPLIVMHAVGAPGGMVHERRHRDVVSQVHASLARSLALARTAGVRDVVVDPGFGFGKTPEENLQLVGGLGRLADLGCPILIGISRKSTIGTVLGSEQSPVSVHERLYGTLGATAMAVLRGAVIVRTHDVRPTMEMLKVIAAIAAAERECHA